MKTRRSPVTAAVCASELARESREGAIVAPGRAEGTFLCMALDDPDCCDEAPRLAHLAGRDEGPFLALFDADGLIEWAAPGFLPSAAA